MEKKFGPFTFSSKVERHVGEDRQLDHDEGHSKPRVVSFSSHVERQPGYIPPKDLKAQVLQLAKVDGPELPFEIRGLAWIGTERTRSGMVTRHGSISLDYGKFILSDVDGSAHVRCDPHAIDVERVPGYGGMGLKLSIADHGVWFVQPVLISEGEPVGLRLVRAARKITRRFESALALAKE